MQIKGLKSVPLIFVSPANVMGTLQNMFSENDHLGFDGKKVSSAVIEFFIWFHIALPATFQEIEYFPCATSFEVDLKLVQMYFYTTVM